MKTMKRVMTFTALLLILLINYATGQVAFKGSAQIAATLGSGTSASVYYAYDADLLPGLDYSCSLFHSQWGLLKEGLLEQDSAVFLRDPVSFAVNGRGVYSGNTINAGKKRDGKCSIQIFATDKGGRYKAGTTHFLVKDDLGLVTWLDLTYNNVFGKIELPAPITID